MFSFCFYHPPTFRMGGGDERKGETVGGVGAISSTATNGDGKRQRAAVPAGARVRGASAATAAATPRQSASSLVPTTTTITVWLVAVDAGDLATTSVFFRNSSITSTGSSTNSNYEDSRRPLVLPSCLPRFNNNNCRWGRTEHHNDLPRQIWQSVAGSCLRRSHFRQ